MKLDGRGFSVSGFDSGLEILYESFFTENRPVLIIPFSDTPRVWAGFPVPVLLLVAIMLELSEACSQELASDVLQSTAQRHSKSQRAEPNTLSKKGPAKPCRCSLDRLAQAEKRLFLIYPFISGCGRWFSA